MRPLEAPPQALRALFRGPAPPTGPSSQSLRGDEVDVAVSDKTTQVAADGRVTHTTYTILRVVDGAAVDAVKVASRDWRPWLAERPEIQARVLTPDGAMLTLDPHVLSEQPVRTDGGTDTDLRSLHAPLPGVQVGSIVEVLTVGHERRSPAASGRLHVTHTLSYAPVRHWRRRVIVPAGAPFHWYTSGPHGLAGTSAQSGDRVTWSWEQRDVPGAGSLEPGTPREAWARPFLVWSTSPGWGAVARDYAAPSRRATRPAAAGGARQRPGRPRLPRASCGWTPRTPSMTWGASRWTIVSVAPSWPPWAPKGSSGPSRERTTTARRPRIA